MTEWCKNQVSNIYMNADGFHSIWLLFAENIKNNVYALNSLTNYENPSSTPLQEACSGFQVAACDSKSCFKSRL